MQKINKIAARAKQALETIAAAAGGGPRTGRNSRNSRCNAHAAAAPRRPTNASAVEHDPPFSPGAAPALLATRTSPKAAVSEPCSPKSWIGDRIDGHRARHGTPLSRPAAAPGLCLLESPVPLSPATPAKPPLSPSSPMGVQFGERTQGPGHQGQLDAWSWQHRLPCAADVKAEWARSRFPTGEAAFGAQLEAAKSQAWSRMALEHKLHQSLRARCRQVGMSLMDELGGCNVPPPLSLPPATRDCDKEGESKGTDHWSKDKAKEERYADRPSE